MTHSYNWLKQRTKNYQEGNVNQPEGNVDNQPVVVPLDLRDHQDHPDLQDPQDLQEENQKRDLIFFE